MLSALNERLGDPAGVLQHAHALEQGRARQWQHLAAVPSEVSMPLQGLSCMLKHGLDPCRLKQLGCVGPSCMRRQPRWGGPGTARW